MRAILRTGVVGVALLASATFISPQTTEAGSAPCSRTDPVFLSADHVVAGAYVQVGDDTDTRYRSACLRIYGTDDGRNWPVVQSGGRVWVTTQLRDTAHDGRLAVGMLRFWFSDGSIGSWSVIQTTPKEYWSAPEVKEYRMTKVPIGVQFAACRSAKSAIRPTSACGLSEWLITPGR